MFTAISFSKLTNHFQATFVYLLALCSCPRAPLFATSTTHQRRTVGVNVSLNVLLRVRSVLVMRISVQQMIVRPVSNEIDGTIKTVFVGRTIRTT
jgi:hypothetical protein